MTAIPATLTDTYRRPLRDLRISVIDNCNLRCAYCMPAERYGESYAFLPEHALLSFDEIERLAAIFAELGVAKLRLTGGEPLLRKNLPELVARLGKITSVEETALTTNGLLLPKFAAPLRDAGLDRVTVSLDTLDDTLLSRMSGRAIKVQHVLAGVDAALSAGLRDIKINAVVQRGVNDESVLALVERFRGTGVIVRFIEYMDVGNINHWRMDEVVPSAELRDRIGAVYPMRPLGKNYRGEVARRYAFEDGSGEIGFISSVTAPFCGDCTRARLSAEGKLYTCLFANEGFDLRALMRNAASDQELRDAIAAVWTARTDRYSEERGTAAIPREKVEMYHIGG